MDSNNNNSNNSNNNNNNNNNNDNTKELIQRVFKNVYLLRLILKQTRNYHCVTWLGVQVPKYDPSFLAVLRWPQVPSDESNSYSPLRRRYKHLLHDLEWVLKNRYYSLFRDIMTAHGKEATVPTRVIELTRECVQDGRVVRMLLETLPNEFTTYFSTSDGCAADHMTPHQRSKSGANPYVMPAPSSLRFVAQYLMSIVENGCFESWTAVVSFVNKGLAKRVIRPPPPPQVSALSAVFSYFVSGTGADSESVSSNDADTHKHSILHLLLHQNTQLPPSMLKSRNMIVDMIIKLCITSNKKEILANIFETVGVDRVCAFIKLMADQPGYSQVSEYLLGDTIDNSETLAYVASVLPFKYFNILFKDPQVIIFRSKDIGVIAKYLTSPINTYNNDISILQLLCDSIKSKLSHPNTSTMSSPPSFQLLSTIINHFKQHIQINLKDIVDTINSFTPPPTLSSPITTKKNNNHKNNINNNNLPINENNNILYCAELFFLLSKHDQKTRETLERDYFSQPEWKKDKSLVAIYQCLIKQLDNNDSEHFQQRCQYLLNRVGFGFICLFGSLALVKTSFSLLQKDQSGFGKHRVHLLSSNVKVLEFCFDIILKSIAGGVGQQFVVYEIAESTLAVSKAFERDEWDVIKYLTIKVLPVIDELKVFNITLELHASASRRSEIQVVQAIKPYCLHFPNYSVDPQLLSSTIVEPTNIEEPTTTEYRETYQDEDMDPRVEEKLNSRYKFQITQTDVYIDRPIQMLHIGYVKRLIQTYQDYIVIQDPQTWKTVGMHGSVAWVEEILLKYTKIEKMATCYDLLREGAKQNHDYGGEILQYIDNLSLKILPTKMLPKK
ncbi:hypothetical protein DFA_06852 [Cavenderia fasciculata]|uniref:Uncharacterized protein n=1 Tax=Cavenderia fasciculata TaxID=261658 RepID=F4PWU9_CACFS|nr:uncharacterized protein DFA_06852 [Cavenderia fasciculata]EGG19752.1 hypothetical protein DFA_06852 [Cavenderia fasciculata]|eukprot:XP_004358098.1 hypothetical protein DFA_06852 [Cavenderia fasciculata]